MYHLNRVTLIGRLTADPELKTTSQDTPIATMHIATNFSWKDASGQWQQGVDFHRVVAFRRLAQQIGEHLKKGRTVYVEGRVKTRSWKNEEGKTQYMTEVIADKCFFLDHAQGAMFEKEDETEEAAPDAVSVQEVDMAAQF